MSSPSKSFFQAPNNPNYPLDSSRMAVNIPDMQAQGWFPYGINKTRKPSGRYGIMPSNSPVFIVQAPRLKRTYDTYEMTFAKVCGVVQVVCGILSLALGIASPFECGRLGFVGYGIWSGVMYIVAGIIEWMSAEERTTFLIVTTTVLSVINSCLGAIQFCLGTYSANGDSVELTKAAKDRTCPMPVATFSERVDWQAAVVIDALLACVGLVEAAAAIFASIACCVVVCGPQDYTTASHIPIRRNRVLPAQFVFTSNQPPMSFGNNTYITGTSRE